MEGAARAKARGQDAGTARSRVCRGSRWRAGCGRGSSQGRRSQQRTSGGVPRSLECFRSALEASRMTASQQGLPRGPGRPLSQSQKSSTVHRGSKFIAMVSAAAAQTAVPSPAFEGRRGQILTPEASRRDQLRSSQALVLVQDGESGAAHRTPGLRARPRHGQPPPSPAAPKSVCPEQGSLGPSLHPQPTSRKMQCRKQSVALSSTSQNLCSREKKVKSNGLHFIYEIKRLILSSGSCLQDVCVHLRN